MAGNLNDPIQEVNRLRARLHALLDATYPEPRPASPLGRVWTPAADILATGQDVTVQLEVCGVPREAIDVTLEGTVLTVSGRRERESSGTTEEFFQAERPFGDFLRSFSLPFEPREVQAQLQEGVLTIVLQR